jgi:hypothetical protein
VAIRKTRRSHVVSIRRRERIAGSCKGKNADRPDFKTNQADSRVIASESHADGHHSRTSAIRPAGSGAVETAPPSKLRSNQHRAETVGRRWSRPDQPHLSDRTPLRFLVHPVMHRAMEGSLPLTPYRARGVRITGQPQQMCPYPVAIVLDPWAVIVPITEMSPYPVAFFEDLGR